MERTSDLERSTLDQMHRVAEAVEVAVMELAALASDKEQARAIAATIDRLVSEVELAGRVDVYAVLMRLRPDLQPLYEIAALRMVDCDGEPSLNLPMRGLTPAPPRRSR